MENYKRKMPDSDQLDAQMILTHTQGVHEGRGDTEISQDKEKE